MIKIEDEQDKQLLLQAADIILKAGGVSAFAVANRLILALNPVVVPPVEDKPVEEPPVEG
jgi:hypothetical protein